MSESYLVVDAGHTRVKLAICEEEDPSRLPRVLHMASILYGQPIDWSAVKDWVVSAPPTGVIVTGTNSDRVREVIDLWPSDFPAPCRLTDKSLLPLDVQVDEPAKVGIDRLLNAVAANRLRRALQPAITVSTGTAITVDVVDGNGTFQGGAILPGILLGAKSLHEETTTLPLVDVWELLKREPAPLGKNTEAAIASGLYWGHLGAVREIVTRYRGILGNDGIDPLVLLTGGAAGILAPYLPGARHEPGLTLQGLAIVAGGLQPRGGRIP